MSTLRIASPNVDDAAASVPATPAITAVSPPALATLLVGRLDAYRALGLTARTGDRLAAGGKLPPCIRLGGKTMYRIADIESFVVAGCDVEQWRAEQARKQKEADDMMSKRRGGRG